MPVHTCARVHVCACVCTHVHATHTARRTEGRGPRKTQWGAFGQGAAAMSPAPRDVSYALGEGQELPRARAPPICWYVCRRTVCDLSREAEDVEAPPPPFRKASSRGRGPALLQACLQTPPNLLPCDAANRAGRAPRRPGAVRSAPRDRGGETRATSPPSPPGSVKREAQRAETGTGAVGGTGSWQVRPGERGSRPAGPGGGCTALRASWVRVSERKEGSRNFGCRSQSRDSHSHQVRAKVPWSSWGRGRATTGQCEGPRQGRGTSHRLVGKFNDSKCRVTVSLVPEPWPSASVSGLHGPPSPVLRSKLPSRPGRNGGPGPWGHAPQSPR